MSGLRKIARLFGGITIKGNDGKKVEYEWDYKKNIPVVKKTKKQSVKKIKKP